MLHRLSDFCLEISAFGRDTSSHQVLNYYHALWNVSWFERTRELCVIIMITFHTWIMCFIIYLIHTLDRESTLDQEEKLATNCANII